VRESYVGEMGKSMKAEEMAAIPQSALCPSSTPLI
jgi:hypothetical protein